VSGRCSVAGLERPGCRAAPLECPLWDPIATAERTHPKSSLSVLMCRSKTASLFDHLSASASSVGGIVIPRASPLLDQICPHSQIQKQTTRYSNQY
jgi:hypothetical protein